MGRRYSSLHIYISREFFFSFVVAFLFFFFIFFINQLLLLAEDILSKHVAFLDVVLLVVYSLPAIVAISFPFASLVGSLMAVGRLSSDNEMLALQASGVPNRQVFIPLLLLSFVFSLFSFVMNDYFLPLGTINFGKLYTKILYTNPQLALEPFSVKRYQNATIISGSVEHNKISNIVIFDTTELKNKRVITAASAVLSKNTARQGLISLRLTNVLSETNDLKKTDQFTYSTAASMVYNILLSDVSISLRPPTAREMSSLDVYRLIQHKSVALRARKRAREAKITLDSFNLMSNYRAAVDESSVGSPTRTTTDRLARSLDTLRRERSQPVVDRSLRIDRIELNRKFSVPFASLFFVIFAFPVGLTIGRSGRSVGFGVGLLVSVLYWGMLVAGQSLGYRFDYSPIISMWFPNLVVLALGIVFSFLRLRR